MINAIFVVANWKYGKRKNQTISFTVEKSKV